MGIPIVLRTSSIGLRDGQPRVRVRALPWGQRRERRAVGESTRTRKDMRFCRRNLRPTSPPRPRAPQRACSRAPPLSGCRYRAPFRRPACAPWRPPSCFWTWSNTPSSPDGASGLPGSSKARCSSSSLNAPIDGGRRPRAAPWKAWACAGESVTHRAMWQPRRQAGTVQHGVRAGP